MLLGSADERIHGRVSEAVSARSGLALYSVTPVLAAPISNTLKPWSQGSPPRPMISDWKPQLCPAPGYPPLPRRGLFHPLPQDLKFEPVDLRGTPTNYAQGRVPRTTILRSVLPILMGTPLSQAPGFTPTVLDPSPQNQRRHCNPLLGVSKPSSSHFWVS